MTDSGIWKGRFSMKHMDTFYEWFEGERVSDLVGTAVSEQVSSLHGEHCYAEVEVVEWTHRHGRQVTGTTFVLVCGWPVEHK